MSNVAYDFSDETVVVTGASSGIGREIALEFAKAGAAVVVADVRRDPRDETEDVPTHELIERANGDVSFVHADVSVPSDLEAAVDAAHEYGGVDVMVNNAGIHVTGSIRELPPETLDEIYAVNVRGTFVGCQVAANDMIERGVEGRIINLASISSVLAKPEQIAYEMTKGAIRMITLSAALELAESGVRVNAVAPGRIATSFGGTTATEKAAAIERGEGVKRIPLGRAGRPADIAGATLFLASSDAQYVTGELLFVDGGYRTY